MGDSFHYDSKLRQRWKGQGREFPHNSQVRHPSKKAPYIYKYIYIFRCMCVCEVVSSCS